MPGACKRKVWGDSGTFSPSLPLTSHKSAYTNRSSGAHQIGTPASCPLTHRFSEVPWLPATLGVLRGQVVQGGHAETGDDRPPALLGQELVPHGLLGLVRVLHLGAGQRQVPRLCPWPDSPFQPD